MRPEHWVYAIPLRLRSLFRRREADQQLDDELRDHVESKIEECIAKGLKPKEARRQALLELRGLEQTKEKCRDARHVSWIQDLVQDLRFGFRMLRKSPGFTAVAVFTLALGIGATTAIFSAYYGVVLNTFPFTNADRVTSFGIQDLSRPTGGEREGLSFPEFLYFRQHNDVFEDISGEYGGFGTTPVRYTSGSSTYQFDADYLSVNSFRFFGTRPALGRLPTADDVKAGVTPVFVMGYKLWRSQFDSDPKIVGKSFMLNGVARTLVGIMPPRFRWAWVDIWIPFGLDPNEASTDPELKRVYLYAVGRLKPGVSLKEAAANLNVVAHQYAKIDPADYPKRFTVITSSLSDRVTGGFKDLIYPLFGASLLLLLIAASNVANLLLARATTRYREIAIRASLGATPGRLIRQLLIESSVLAMAGCLGGCFLAWLAIEDIVPLIPYNAFPQEAVIRLNWPVLAFALGIGLLVTLLCGLTPAVRAARGNFQSRLMAIGRSLDADPRHGTLRNLLVVVEVALSVILLVGAGLLTRTFLSVEDVNLGFNPRNILSMEISIPVGTGVRRTVQGQKQLLHDLFEKIQSIPGVAAATVAIPEPPFGRALSELSLLGQPHSGRWTSLLSVCGTGYFDVLQLRLLQGRWLSRSDVDTARQVAVINQTFASKYFGGSDALGRQVEFKMLDQLPNMPHPVFRVIGVVSDIKNRGLAASPAPEAFLPYSIVGGWNGWSILLRSVVNPDSLVPTIRQQVWSVDSDLAVINPHTTEDLLQRDALASPRFEFIFIGTFAAVGLALAITGLFGVIAYSVAQRTHEIGVRVALGAQRGDVLRMVIREGMFLSAIGIATGIGGALALTRFLRTLLFEIKPTDPATFAAVIIVLILVALLACYIPARRAMRVDPMVALRYE